MKTFKEYLSEALPTEKEMTQVSEKDLVQLLGKGKVNSMVKHPWFKEYSNWERAYKHGVSRAGFHKVDVFFYFSHTHTTVSGKIRPTVMLQFTFSYNGTKVIQVYKYYRDKEPDENEKRLGSSTGWKFLKAWDNEPNAIVKAWDKHWDNK